MDFPFQALLVIDMQRHMAERWPDVVSRVHDLTQAFPPDRQYWGQFFNAPNTLFQSVIGWDAMQQPPETDIVPLLQANVQNLFMHSTYTLPAHVLDRLRQYRNVGLCGMETHVCIPIFAAQLWDAGIRPYICADYCHTMQGQERHEAALKLASSPFGKDGILNGDYRNWTL